MKNRALYIIAFLTFPLLWTACKKDQPEVDKPTLIAEDEQMYPFDAGALPMPNLPADNPLNVSKVELGRKLFYDKKLSGNNTQACADCHRQEDAFSDIEQFSTGINGLQGERQAMSVVNMAWNTNGFFWDGRSDILRHQALLPIQDPLEMDETVENVLVKLQADPDYPLAFAKAFGNPEITEETLALALEAFMLTIVSTNSKYDQYLAQQTTLTDAEMRGMELFFAEYNPFFPEDSGADCAHCHSGANFENDQYMNNGLDAEVNFTDLGFYEVTQNDADRAKFKVTTLRNIELTPPYMHDGRFATLEEVVDHYNEGIESSSTVDVTVLNTQETGLLLTEEDKADLVAFLKTLTDHSLLEDERYSNPFE